MGGGRAVGCCVVQSVARTRLTGPAAACPGVAALAGTAATLCAPRGPAPCIPGGLPVVHRLVEALHVPFQQRTLYRMRPAQRAGQQLVELDRALRQLQPLQVVECAVHDGVGAGVEQACVDVAQALLQVMQALRVAQRDMQHLVGHQAGLQRER